MKDERKQVERELIEDFTRWEHLCTYGGQDPNWEDGCNLNLVRNHIINNKRRLEALEYFPEIYSKETPPEVDNKYMARAEEIRENAKKTLAIYLVDSDYLYLVENAPKVNKKQSESICLSNVIGYVSGLKKFIETDNLVRMRLHENPDRYLDSFKSCRKKLEKILNEPKPEKVGQLDIFDFI